MPLFAVLALKDSDSAVDAAVRREFPNDSYQIEDGKWIVNADVATAKQLSSALGLREAAHLVLSMRGYSGRAQPDLWEWLAAQLETHSA